jgi:hypothetical protein
MCDGRWDAATATLERLAQECPVVPPDLVVSAQEVGARARWSPAAKPAAARVALPPRGADGVAIPAAIARASALVGLVVLLVLATGVGPLKLNPLAALIAAACNPDVWLAGWVVGFVMGAVGGLVVVTGAGAYTLCRESRIARRWSAPPAAPPVDSARAAAPATSLRPGQLLSE